MRKSTNIPLKAFFLLIVFFSNIVIGFACSVGVQHTHTESHHHSQPHHHSEPHSHDHAKAVDHHADKENCCKDEITKLEKTDKIVPSAVKDYNHPQSAVIIAPVFYNFDIAVLNTQHLKTRYYNRNYHPPISDIRIAVQSFQI
nr:hypothetical protein [Pedobacter panaciterrae]